MADRASELQARKRALAALFSDPAQGLTSTSFLAAAKKAGYSAKEAKAVLEGEPAFQTHKETRGRPFHSIAAKPHSYQADLTMYDQYKNAAGNKHHTAILTIIEITTRYAYAYPLRKKTAEEVGARLADWVVDATAVAGAPPVSLTTDLGNEFKGASARVLSKHGIEYWASSERKYNTAKIERFNRTLRGLISRWFEVSGGHAWVEVLPELLKNYNNRPSRALGGLTPASVQADAQKALEAYYNDMVRGEPAAEARRAIRVGDLVRTRLKEAGKQSFEKGEAPRWSDTIYTVDSAEENHFRVRGPDGVLARRAYTARELLEVRSLNLPVAAAPVVAKGASGDRVDLDGEAAARRLARRLKREGIDPANAL